MSNEIVINGDVSNFELAPVANHVAICVALAMLGTQEETFQGHVKKTKKIALGFELCGPKMQDGKPFIVWKEYSLTMGSKANLRIDLESWRGEKMTDKEAEGFNIAKVVGAAGLANVVSATSKVGKERRDIKTITPVPSTVPVQAQITPSLIFVFSNPFNNAAFEALPKWIQDKIKKSDEYLKAVGASPANNAQAAAPAAQGGAPRPF